MTLKNIIFDLGGVLYQINYEESFWQLSEVLGIDLRLGQWPPWFKQLVINYETGKISTEGFIWSLQKNRGTDLIPTPDRIISAWNSMLVGWNDEIFSTLEHLKNNYRLFVLSNINPLHLDYVENQMRATGGIEVLNSIFEKIYFSHLIGMRKPSVRCFQLILKEGKLVPSETAFIDDYPKNILEAKQLGIHCIVHEPDKRLKFTLKNSLGIVC